MTMRLRFAAPAALLAAASMIASPVAAAELPRPGAPAVAEAVLGSNAMNADHYRRWHRRDGVDAGDVIAGVLVLGTIAAVASAASKSSRDRGEPYPRSAPYPDRPYDYRGAPYDQRYDSRGIGRAVDMCAREVERRGQVDSVDRAERNADGWHVSGRLRSGEPFDCSIGNDGRIDGIDYGRSGGGYLGAQAEDRQWSAERYAAARQAQDSAVPAYPGGTVGDEAASSDGDVGG